MKKENSEISICMLGNFSVTAGGREIVSSSARAGQIWNLLQYLVTFRHKSVTQTELIDAMWEEGTSDPVGALKNRVWRIRRAFEDAGVRGARDIILFTGGSYSWNNSVPCSVDTEKFEECCTAAAAEGLSDSDRIRQYRRAIDLYAGEFLSSSDVTWAEPVARRYHTLYFNSVQNLLQLYEKSGDFDSMYTVAGKAVTIDQFEEVPHRYILVSLLGQGRQAEALKYYNYVSELFYRELGAGPSEDLRALYMKIAQAAQDARTNLDVLRDDMREDPSTVKGAFYCEYEVFKSLYRIEARSAARRGSSAFLGLLGIEAPRGQTIGKETLDRSMRALQRSIMLSLRRGDIFCRCSASQYVMMLSPITRDDGQIVLTRIEKDFGRVCHSRKVLLTRDLQPLLPVRE